MNIILNIPPECSEYVINMKRLYKIGFQKVWVSYVNSPELIYWLGKLVNFPLESAGSTVTIIFHTKSCVKQADRCLLLAPLIIFTVIVVEIGVTN